MAPPGRTRITTTGGMNAMKFMRLRRPEDAVADVLGLRLRAWPSLAKKATKSDEMDEWGVTIDRADGITPMGGVQSFSYSTGLGLRVRPDGTRYVNWRSADGLLDLTPMEPKCLDVLEMLARDAMEAREMPGDDGEAMDYLYELFGPTESRPSELLKSVRDLRENLRKIEALLQGSGLTLDDFEAGVMALVNPE